MRTPITKPARKTRPPSSRMSQLMGVLTLVTLAGYSGKKIVAIEIEAVIPGFNNILL